LEVLPDGPAHTANIRAGDRLLQLGETEIESPEQLTRLMGQRKPGEKVRLVVARNGQRFEADATLADAGKVAAANRQANGREVRGYRGADPETVAGEDAWVGVLLSEAQGQQGATIARVYPTSPAARADLFDGDRILEVDGQAIASAEQFVDIVEQHQPGDTLTLRVLPEGRREPRSVEVTLSRRSDFRADDATPGGDLGDPLFEVPEYEMRMEHQRRMARQHERLEGLMLELLREVRDLRAEVDELKQSNGQAQ